MKRILCLMLAAALILSCGALASNFPSRPTPHIHHWVDTGDAIQPTCTDEGVVYEYCDLCGERRERILAPLGHRFTEPWTTLKEPTCTEAGREMNTCTRKNWPDYITCGYEWYRDIPALGHEWGPWHVVKEAKDGFSGLEERACARCGETEQQVYYEENPEVYAATLSVSIDDAKEFYAPGDTVKFTCTLTNISDTDAYTYTGWYNTWGGTQVIYMMGNNEGHTCLHPGESCTYAQDYTVEEGAVEMADFAYGSSSVALSFGACMSSAEGYMSTNDVEILLPVEQLALYAYSTDWDEDSAIITCELTNNTSRAVVMNGHSYAPDNGSASYQSDLLGVIIGPGDTYAYKVTCPVEWDEDEDPEGQIITIRADGVASDSGRQVFSNAVDVCVGYEMGDMELIVEQREISTPANGAYYTEGETIQYEIILSNCQYYRLYSVTANVIPYDSHDYTVGEAEIMAGAGVLTFSAYHTVTYDDCDRGFYENNVYGTWFSGKDDLDGEANEIDGESVVSLCGTGDEAVLLKKEISTPPNGDYYVPGDKVEYELTFVNGAEPLSGMGLFDAMFLGSDSRMVAAVPDLAPGGTFTTSFEYTVTEKDAAEGEIVNMATAHAAGEDLDELPYVNSNLVSVVTGEDTSEPSEGPTSYPKGIKLNKVCLMPCANGAFFTAGETVSYGITLYNESEYDLGEIAVFDPLNGPAPIKQVGGLKPGESVTAAFDYTVTEADVLKAFIENVAYADVDFDGGNFTVFSNPVIVPTGEMEYPDYSQELSLEAELQVVSVPANLMYYIYGETVYYNAVIVNTSPWPCQVTASAVPISGSAPRISLGTHEIDAYCSVSVPFQHVISSADTLVGSVTMGVEAQAIYQLPNGTDHRTAAASETVPCEKSEPISSTRPGVIQPPAGADDEQNGIVLIQTLTKLPKNGVSFMPGESIEIDLTLINHSNLRFGYTKCYDVLSDNPGMLVGSVNAVMHEPVTWHLSYTVTEDDAKLGRVYSDAWVSLGVKRYGPTLMVVNAETMEIPAGNQSKRGLGHVIPGRRPIPGRLGSRKTLIRYTDAMRSADRAAKLLFEKLPEDIPNTAALRLGEEIWETVLVNEYDSLAFELAYKGAPAEAIENDRAMYGAYLDAYKARLLASGAEEQAYALLADEMRDRASELGYILETRDGAREDLQTIVIDAAAPEEDAASFTLEDLNEFAFIKTVNAGEALRPYVLLAKRILEDETRSEAEKQKDAVLLWAAALDECYSELADAADGNVISLLAAERAAFADFAEARSELYTALYPDGTVSAILTARLYEEKAVQLSAER
ncbi:MAG: hypothetical protein II912_04125 [Clostridia bacterium]|nr:hypothetical protein [Clostridia bacterium]